jgi:hypothetical protein
MLSMRAPRHSTVAAYLALFVALGGTSYAAIKLPANSVGSREIKSRSVQTSDLATSARLSKTNRVFRAAVTDVVLDPGTQSVVNALAGAVKGEKGETGIGGEKGPVGAAGPTGADGIDGVSGYVIRDAYSSVLDAGETGGAVAKCEDGERVISGGGRFEADGLSGALPVASYPQDDTGVSGWSVIYSNGGSGSPSGKVHAFAVCAKVS